MNEEIKGKMIIEIQRGLLNFLSLPLKVQKGGSLQIFLRILVSYIFPDKILYPSAHVKF